MSEFEIQKKVVEHCKNKGYLYCATVGGVHCSIRQRGKMKASGYVKGVPDLFLFEPRGDKHGMAIELKTPTGRTTAEQKQWLMRLGENGYHALVCKSAEVAIQAIEDYINEEVEDIREKDKQLEEDCVLLLH